jgi:hypothetical protein
LAIFQPRGSIFQAETGGCFDFSPKLRYQTGWMKLIGIEVECYAGFKADETPRRFLWLGEWIEVEDVLDRWYQAAGNPEWPMADYFKVIGADGRQFLLKHDREADAWFLSREWPLGG